MKQKIIPGNNYAEIPENDTGRPKPFKKPRKFCKYCKKGYTSFYLNSFSKINKICGSCEFNPVTNPEYAKNSIDYKGENIDAKESRN